MPGEFPLSKAVVFVGSVCLFIGCQHIHQPLILDAQYAARMGLKMPANEVADNPGWPGCCYPPGPKYYHWIPPHDWSVVAAYHKMEIPDNVRTAINNMNNMNASVSHRLSSRERFPGEKLSVETSATRSIQQPVPIPHSKGAATGVYQSRSYSPSAIYLPSSDRSPPRSSISSKDSNSSGSPPSANGSRRRDYDFEGSERSSNSPTSPTRSSSQDSHTIAIPGRSPSSLQHRRGESPIDRVVRDKEPAGGGKRRSNSDPKNQSPPSAYGYDRAREIPQGRERDKESARDRDRDSPTQTRLKPSPVSAVSSNHPYSNPHSPASSSMSRLSHAKPAPAPTPAFRVPAPPPRVRETSGPSITSVMANMSLNRQGTDIPPYIPASHNATVVVAAAAAHARTQTGSPMKRGVIPPHVHKAGSVISATSSSSSSTNSSAQEGTVVSDGAFTDYVRCLPLFPPLTPTT